MQRHHVVFNRRQPEYGAGSLAHLADEFKCAAKLLRHAVHHGEAEAGPLANTLGGEERLSSPPHRFAVHAGPLVAHHDADIVARLKTTS